MGIVEKIILLVTVFLLVAMVTCSIARADNDDTALWLARSCVGEAGWDAYSTGECAAIWHVFRKRGDAAGTGTLDVAMKYSSPIKKGAHRRNRWVMGLGGEERPPGWPPGASWERYRDKWERTLEQAEMFVAGNVDDPLPVAMHFGSVIDEWNVQHNWKRLKSPGFRNRFYSVR